MRKLNVLVISSNWFPCRSGYMPGGGEAVILNTTSLMVAQGHTVTMFASNDSDDSVHNGAVKVEKWAYNSKFDYVNKGLPVPKFMSANMTQPIKEFCKNNPVDIIISHSMAAGVIKHISNIDIPSIHFIHNPAIYGMGSLAALDAWQYAIKKGKLAVAVAQWVADANNKQAPESTNYVNYVFFTHDSYPAIPTEAPEKRGIICQRFIARKNGHIGIEAFSRAGVPALVIGTPTNNPPSEVAFYQNVIIPCVDKFKSTTEFQTDMPNAQVLIELSKSTVLFEGDVKSTMPIVPNESLVVGCSVVKYGVGDGVDELKMLLGNPPNVVSVSPTRGGNHAIAIADAVTKMLDIPMDERIDVANKARSLFSKANWVKNFEQMCSDAGVKDMT